MELPIKIASVPLRRRPLTADRLALVTLTLRNSHTLADLRLRRLRVVVRRNVQLNTLTVAGPPKKKGTTLGLAEPASQTGPHTQILCPARQFTKPFARHLPKIAHGQLLLAQPKVKLGRRQSSKDVVDKRQEKRTGRTERPVVGSLVA